MYEKLVCLIIVVLTLSMGATASAALVAQWSFDNNTTDSVGTLNWTLEGGASYSTDAKEGSHSLMLDGTDDHAYQAAVGMLNSAFGAKTVMMWFKADSVNGAQVLYDEGGYTNGLGIRVNNGALQAGVVNANVGFTASTPFDSPRWTHVAAVFDSGSLLLYVNGEQQAVTAATFTTVGGHTSAAGIGARRLDGPFGVAGTGDHFAGLIDDVRLYDNAVTADEIRRIGSIERGKASQPAPTDGQTDVARQVVVTWEPGESADRHDVYFAASFDEVNNAGNLDPIGPDNVYKGRFGVNSYDVGRILDFGQTYYWRVDEVNAPPADNVVVKGDVWSFTVEPFAYPIENIAVTASSANRDEEGPENTINGSGLDGDNLHSFDNMAMWLSNIMDPDTAWIQYEFDTIYKLHQMNVWNYNSSVEPVVGFGIRQASIEYSTDGVNWSTLGTTHEFARAPGAPGYAPNTTIDLGGVTAKYVKITAENNWGGIVNQYGLSEVRFLYVPVLASDPNPDSGAAAVPVDAVLSFKPGREAARHDVYLDADEQAVIDGAVPVATVTEPGYTSSLDLAGTYYWRIDEVNDAETPTTWQGDIWSFSTQEYRVVDDFDSYNDIPAGEEGSNLIYETWIDGFGTTTNGSTIGYTTAFQPSMETSFVHDGRQSVPLSYDNTAASYSEVTANVADLQAGPDWTGHGIKALTLRFFGDPENVAQQMYVKINGVKVPYDGSAENTRLAGWQMWYIDLASTGANLGNVTELSVGFERIGTLGGQGVVLLDSIRLYSHDRQSITPVDPGAAGLQAHFEFEGNTNDSSGNARNGTKVGSPFFDPGKVGKAVSLNGLGDYVEITGYKGVLGSSAVTVTAWVKTTSTGTTDGGEDSTNAIVGWGSGGASERFGFRIDAGRLRVEHAGGNIQGKTNIADGKWHHVAVTVRENSTISYPQVILYLDGNDDTRPTTDPDPFNITAAGDVRIGSRPAGDDRFFSGQIDDLRIYDRALTQEEIAWLAGRIESFDKAF